MFVSSITTDDSENVNLQGGVSLVVNKKWAAHVRDNGSDPLGRWVWVTLFGSKGRKLTVVSAYRPNEGGPRSGSKTVWQQQYEYFTTKDSATMSTKPIKIDPQERFLVDLRTLLERKRKRDTSWYS